MEVPFRRVGGVRSGCSVEMWCCVHKCQEHYSLCSNERRTYSFCSLQCSSQEASMIYVHVRQIVRHAELIAELSPLDNPSLYA